jgi:polyhydroxyalkanoate synthesis regulator phasin
MRACCFVAGVLTQGTLAAAQEEVTALQAQLADMREDFEMMRRARDDLSRKLLQQQPNAAGDGGLVSMLKRQLADLRKQKKAAVEPQQVAAVELQQSALQVRTGLGCSLGSGTPSGMFSQVRCRERQVSTQGLQGR